LATETNADMDSSLSIWLSYYGIRHHNCSIYSRRMGCMIVVTGDFKDRHGIDTTL
jgi:hypothetical protein